MVIRFEPGKRYKFINALRIVYGLENFNENWANESSNWGAMIDGEEIKVIDETLGVIGIYNIPPHYCEEII